MCVCVCVCQREREAGGEGGGEKERRHTERDKDRQADRDRDRDRERERDRQTGPYDILAIAKAVAPVRNINNLLSACHLSGIDREKVPHFKLSTQGAAVGSLPGVAVN